MKNLDASTSRSTNPYCLPPLSLPPSLPPSFPPSLTSLLIGDIKNANSIFTEMIGQGKGRDKFKKDDKQVPPDQFTLDAYIKMVGLYGDMV